MQSATEVVRADEHSLVSSLAVDRMVMVESRTWPGINRQGGVGRITAMHWRPNEGDRDDTATNRSDRERELQSVDVSYVLGGREKRVPVEYVQLAPEFENPTINDTNHHRSNLNGTSSSFRKKPLRDRSLLKGRCKRCGSLRTDCGSCDWLFASNHQQQTNEQIGSRHRASASSTLPSLSLRASNQNTRQTRPSLQGYHSSSSSSDSDSSALLPKDRSQQAGRALPSFSSSSSSSDNDIIKQLVWKRRQRQMEKALKERNDIEFKVATSRKVREASPPQGSKVTKPDERRNREFLSVVAQDKENQCSRSSSGVRPSQQKRRRLVAPSTMKPSVLEILGEGERQQHVKTDSRRAFSRGISKETDHADDSGIDSIVEDGIDVNEFATQDLSDGGDKDEMMARRTDSDASLDAVVDHANDSGAHQIAAAEDQYNQMAPGIEDDLEGFIQPEGAADELPQDIVDRARTIPYVELPAFFEATVECLLNDLPEAKLQTAQLEKQVSVAARQNQSASSLPSLHQEALELLNRLRRNLIHHKLDQCKQAIKYMHSRRRYNVHKRNMTPSQRRPFKLVARDARELKMDEISDEVEQVIRRVRQLVTRATPIDEKMQMQGGYDETLADKSSDDDDEESILVTKKDAAPVFHDLIDLPEFDPHAHATRPKRSHSSRVRSKNTTSNRVMKRQRHAKSMNHVARLKAAETNVEVDNMNEDENDNDARSDDDDDSIMQLEANDEMNLDTVESNVEVPERRRRRRQRRNREVEEIRVHRRHYHGVLQNGSPSSLPRNTVPIADRMQAFLEANTENNQADFHPRGTSSNSKRIKRSRRNLQSSNGSSMRRSMDHPENAHRSASYDVNSTSIDGNEGSVADIVLRRYERMKQGSTPSQHPRHRPNRSRLSNHPRGAKRNEDDIEKLKSIARLGMDSVESTVRAFTLAEEVLRVWNRPFLETVACDYTNLSTHISVYVLILQLLSKASGQNLEALEGTSFALFASGTPCRFIEISLLQALDVLYSLTLSESWALNLPESQKSEMCVEVEDLILALKECNVSISFACTMLQKRLMPQEWRLSKDGNSSFVSCLEPSTLFQLEEPPSAPSRFEQVKKENGLRRLEIDAMWSILAFFGVLPVANGSLSHWKLIRTLLLSLTGVLSEETVKSMDRPINPDHLNRLVDELGYVDGLMRSSFSELPPDDSIVFDVFERSILLMSWSSVCASQIDRKVLRARLGELWQKTAATVDVPNLSSIDQTRNALRSWIVYKCCQTAPLYAAFKIFCRWEELLPQKKARWTRFGKKILQLKTRLQKKIESTRVNTGLDPFLQAFGSAIDPIPSTQRDFLKLSVAQLELYLHSRSHFRKVSGTYPSCPPSKWIPLWNELVGDTLEVSRLKALGGSIENVTDPRERVSYFLLKETAELASSVTFASMGLGPEFERFCDDPGKLVLSFAEDNMLHPLSCLFAITGYTCKLRDDHVVSKEQIELAAFLCEQIARVFKRLLELGNGIGFPTDLLDCLNRMVCETTKMMLASFPPVVCFISKCDAFHEESRIAFRASLLMLRSFVSFKLRLQSKRNLPLAVMKSTATDLMDDDDMFGGIDEAALLALDIEPERTQSSQDSIVTMCSKLLNEGRPSNQFSVANSIQSEPLASTQGKQLVHQFAGGIVAVLIPYSLSSPDSAVIIPSIVEDWHAAALRQENSNDVSYFRALVSCASCEVCLHADRFAEASAIIVSNPSRFLDSWLKAALDAAALERFPSCDTNVMNDIGGDHAEQKERKLLNRLNHANPTDDGVDQLIRIRKHEESDTIGSVSIMTNVWTWARKLGSVCEREGVWFGKHLFDHEKYSGGDYPLSGVACLEAETLRRFRVMKELLTECPDQHLATFTVVSSVAELISVHHGMQYFKKCNRGDADKRSYKQAKITVLYKSYLELSAGMIVVLLNRAHCDERDQSTTVLTDFRDQVVRPLLIQSDFALTAELQRFCSQGSGLSIPTASQEMTQDLRDVLLRHTKDLILCFPTQTRASCFVTALMNARDQNQTLRDVAYGFYGKTGNASITQKTELQLSIDDCLSLLTREPEQVECLEQTVLPKLCSTSLSSSSRRKLLRLLAELLHQESNLGDAVAIRVVCELVRALVASVEFAASQCDLDMLDAVAVASTKLVSLTRLQCDTRSTDDSALQQAKEYMLLYARLMKLISLRVANRSFGVERVSLLDDDEFGKSSEVLKSIKQIESVIAAEKGNAKSSSASTRRNLYRKSSFQSFVADQPVDNQNNDEKWIKLRRATTEYLATLATVEVGD